MIFRFESFLAMIDQASSQRWQSRLSRIRSGEGYIGVTMDVTDRKLTEAALQEAQSELARVARLTTMGEFAASIAHDIMQPLAATVAYGEAARRWLNRDVPNLVEAQDAINSAVNAADRASEVITRIRALLRNDKPNISPSISIASFGTFSG